MKRILIGLLVVLILPLAFALALPALLLWSLWRIGDLVLQNNTMRVVLLLLAISACGKPPEPDTKPEPPTPPKSAPPEPTTPVPPAKPMDNLPVPMPGPKSRTTGPQKRLLAELEIELKNSTCFEWDRNPEPDVIQYHLYISEDGESWGAPRASSADTTACAENLTQGKMYFAMVTALNIAGLESLPSETLPFRTAYIIAPENMVISSTRLLNGDMRLSFEGPVNVMEANGAVVQWSEDLVNWTDIPVIWEFQGGIHYCVIPVGDAQRAFYKMGFKW